MPGFGECFAAFNPYLWRMSPAPLPRCTCGKLRLREVNLRAEVCPKCIQFQKQHSLHWAKRSNVTWNAALQSVSHTWAHWTLSMTWGGKLGKNRHHPHFQEETESQRERFIDYVTVS